MEIAYKYKINETEMDVKEHVIEYTSGIGETYNTLPRHIQRLVSNIRELDVPNEMDVTVDQDIIVATDGSVIFGVGYHSWVVSTVNHFLITRIVAIRKLMLSTILSFRSEMKQGSAFTVFILPHARRVCIGNTLPC
jgi:hypothetical protein